MMDRDDIYYDLYSKYVSELRPLIVKIESMQEKVPQNLFLLIAEMFDAFSDTVGEEKRNDEEWVRTRLDKAKDLRDKAIIICYKTISVCIDERFERIRHGHTKEELRTFPSETLKKIVDAKDSLQRAVKTNYIENYSDAYAKYVEIESFLDDNPQWETSSRDLRKERRVNLWVFNVIIPIVVGVIVAVVTGFLGK